MKMKNKQKTMIGIGIGYAVYVVAGMLIPFLQQKKIEDRPEKENEYFSEKLSVDRASIVETSTDALSIRIRMMEQAKERIILTTFDMRVGESNRDIAAVLMKAADRGVSVKILVDGFSGLIQMRGKPLFQALSLYPNIEVRIYNQINLFTPWGIHGRMHDKYIVTDNECYLLGGRNSFDYFLGDYTEKNRSHDREVFVYNTAFEDTADKSSSLFEVVNYFERIWNRKEVKLFLGKGDVVSAKAVEEETKALIERYQSMRLDNPDWFDETSPLEEGTVPCNKVTLVSGEQHRYGKQPIVFEELKKLMLQAERRVELHTPYAVLGDDMYEGIRQIAQKVPDFTILLNSVENGDNFFASADYLNHKKDILETGVQLMEFDGGDSAHGKSVLIDDRISIIGSYNLDLRSTYMDTELMIVVDSLELNKILDEHLGRFREQSRIVIDETTYENPNRITVEKVPVYKTIGWKIVGILMKPLRFLV